MQFAERYRHTICIFIVMWLIVFSVRLSLYFYYLIQCIFYVQWERYAELYESFYNYT